MASITKRQRTDGGTSYRVAYRVNGKLCWTPSLATAEGALEMKGLIERLGPDLALGVLRQRTGKDTNAVPLLRDWFDRHMSGLEGSATPGTVADYRRMAVRTWLPMLGPLPLDAIDRETVKGWVAWQRKQPTARGRTYSPKSIANAHGLLSSVLASAVEAGHIPSNVARGVSLPSDTADREMEVFTEDEWRRFIDAMAPHYRPLTVFLVATGSRIGEATAVQVRDLDLERSTVRFRRAWKKGEAGVYLGSTKSKRGKRTVVIGSDVAELIAPLCAGKPADALVFTGPLGARISAQHFRSRQWEQALRAAGITKHITPHGLRHTSASWLLAAGVSPIVVQHRLGHESLATTSKVYAHLLTDAQLGAVGVMTRALGQPAQIGGA